MEWLALNEYASTHGISISTLRRRIKTGSVLFKLQNGKYYISPSSSQAKRIKKEAGKLLSEKKKVAPLSSPQRNSLEQESTSSKKHIDTQSKWGQVVADMQKDFLQTIEQKDKKISKQKDQIADLNTLTALLEKENQSLKSLVYKEKEMEEWLEI